MAGKIAISLDGEPIDFAQHYYYKGCMFANVPNLAVVFGYLNASWTLRSDINADYICRVLTQMARKDAAVAVPVQAANGAGCCRFLLTWRPCRSGRIIFQPAFMKTVPIWWTGWPLKCWCTT